MRVRPAVRQAEVAVAKGAEAGYKPRMHDVAKLLIVIYGVVLICRQPDIGVPFMAAFAFSEFVLSRLI